MATHSSVLAWRIPGTGKPGGLPSLGSHRVRHDWSDLAAAAADIAPTNLNQLNALHFAFENAGVWWIVKDLLIPIWIIHPLEGRKNRKLSKKKLRERISICLCYEVKIFSLTLCPALSHIGMHAHTCGSMHAYIHIYTHSFIKLMLISFWAGLTAAWWSVEGRKQTKAVSRHENRPVHTSHNYGDVL